MTLVKEPKKKKNLLGDDLENVVVAKVGLNRVFKSEPLVRAWTGIGTGRRLFFDIHVRGLHISLFLLQRIRTQGKSKKDVLTRVSGLRIPS